jgi:prepilin-type N-terminal cleavage/methylation domain-containing protein
MKTTPGPSRPRNPRLRTVDEVKPERLATRRTAFTLLELLTVIAIIGVIAALAMPVIGKFKPNYTASASRQLLDDLARARQLAISQRTTVCMVFVPARFWDVTVYPQVGVWRPADLAMATNLLDKQLIGYNFVALRGLGDQPGSATPRYLGAWKTLPEGSIIPTNKFLNNGFAFAVPYTNNPIAFLFNGFDNTSFIPFPLEDTPKNPATLLKAPYVKLSYIGFDYMGRMITLDDNDNGRPKPSGRDALIPLAKGAASFARGPDKKPIQGTANFLEQPAGNATNAFNLVHVSWLTGRARGVTMEIR